MHCRQNPRGETLLPRRDGRYCCAGVRILAFEPRKENIKGAENGKLFAICSGAGNHHIVCSKSCGVPPSHVMTIRRHPDPSPGELSSKIYENIRKSPEQCWECQQTGSWELQYIPLQRDFLCKSWYIIIDSKIQNIAISRKDQAYLFFVSVWSLH